MQYVVIFGAAVRPDGKPSGSLERRLRGALSWWAEHPDVCFMPTGGIGKHGPAEARVMQRVLIESGVARSRIVVEDRGRDTLESVRLCDAMLRTRGDCDTIVCCTSAYHQPRCVLLLRLLGYTVAAPAMPADRDQIAWPKLLQYYAKELVATPYDLTLLTLVRWFPWISPSR